MQPSGKERHRMIENTFNIFSKGLSNQDDNTRLTTVLNRLERDLQAVLAGDFALSVTPATPGSSAAAVNAAIASDAAKFTRDVAIKLVDGDGNTIRTNGSFAIAVAEDTTGDGVVAIEDDADSITLVNGEGTVTLEYTGTWAAEDTATLTVTGGEVAGKAVSNKTSVDTLVA